MRRASNIDKNQPDIVKKLKELGFQVVHMHQVGKGFPDLLVNKNKRTWLIEIKASKKSTFTPAQAEFYLHWQGTDIVFLSSEFEVQEFASKVG